MEKGRISEKNNFQKRKSLIFFGAILLVVNVSVLTLLMSGCSKDYLDYSAEYLSAAGVEQVFPLNNSENVEVNPLIGVIFSQDIDPSKMSASLSLTDGTDKVQGSINFSSNALVFSFEDDLKPSTKYTADLTTERKDNAGNNEPFKFSWVFKTGKDHKDNSLKVISVDPPGGTKNVPVTALVTVTLDKEILPWMKGLITLDLKKGQTKVEGTLSVSGNMATFNPSQNLLPGTSYSAMFSYGPNQWGNNNGGNNNNDYEDDPNEEEEDDDDDDDDDDNDKGRSGSSYIWNFTTLGNSGTEGDLIPPVVTSVIPAANAGSVPVNSSLTVTFSEQMNSQTITTSTIYLKEGTSLISGSVIYSGLIATFTPSAVLKAATLYNATVSTGVKDLAGNILAANYTWSFTTAGSADLTPPLIVSNAPANNATDVATNTKISVTFNEPMNPSTINSATFTITQGSVPISGGISYSGNIATFTPSVALTIGTVYSVTITTGVKDISGNSIASAFSSKFTTTGTQQAVLSFASDVVPVLNQCNACHTHKWTTSTNSSTFYTNLVNAGYVNPASPKTSQIYIMLSSGHASSIPSTDRDKILNWMNQGSKNN